MINNLDQSLTYLQDLMTTIENCHPANSTSFIKNQTACLILAALINIKKICFQPQINTANQTNDALETKPHLKINEDLVESTSQIAVNIVHAMILSKKSADKRLILWSKEVYLEFLKCFNDLINWPAVQNRISNILSGLDFSEKNSKDKSRKEKNSDESCHKLVKISLPEFGEVTNEFKQLKIQEDADKRSVLINELNQLLEWIDGDLPDVNFTSYFDENVLSRNPRNNSHFYERLGSQSRFEFDCVDERETEEDEEIPEPVNHSETRAEEIAPSPKVKNMQVPSDSSSGYSGMKNSPNVAHKIETVSQEKISQHQQPQSSAPQPTQSVTQTQNQPQNTSQQPQPEPEKPSQTQNTSAKPTNPQPIRSAPELTHDEKQMLSSLITDLNSNANADPQKNLEMMIKNLAQQQNNQQKNDLQAANLWNQNFLDNSLLVWVLTGFQQNLLL